MVRKSEEVLNKFLRVSIFSLTAEHISAIFLLGLNNESEGEILRRSLIFENKRRR